MEGFVGEGQDFVGDAVGDGEPVKVFQDWGDLVWVRSRAAAFWTSCNLFMEVLLMP